MNGIDELKNLIQNQKSVSTKKLEIVVEKIEKMYLAQGKKINSQKNQLSIVNTQYQREKEKAKRRKAMIQQFEDFKLHHKNLERQHEYLLDKLKKLQEVSK